jgi:hypothetical protein
MKTLLPRVLSLAAVPLLGLAACNVEDYFTGDAPEITDISPAFENGNIGGTILLSRPGWDPENSEDDADLEDRSRVRLDVRNLDPEAPVDDGGCPNPVVAFGSRNAHVLNVGNGTVDVLPPPGPLRGGVVDVRIACPDGIGVLKDGYDYVLGAFLDGEPVDEEDYAEDHDHGPRLEPLFENEYASFVMYYQAEPYINWPLIQGYGIFYSQPAPRASMFLGNNAPLSYGADPGETTRLAPPMIPQLDFVSPVHGRRINAGPDLTFFRDRHLRDLAGSPLALAARKRESDLGPGPAPHGGQVVNNDAAWMVVDYQENGERKKRYLRIGQDSGVGCSFNDHPDCDDDAEAVNDRRLAIDNTWSYFTPDKPTREAAQGQCGPVGFVVDQFGDEVDEHIQYLDALLDGCDPDVDPDACDPGITLPTGTYENVLLCKSFDQFDDFPFEPDGFCIPLETVPSLQLTQGSHFVDLPTRVVGTWARDDDNSVYDGFAGIGDNAMPLDVPVYISYDGGFQEGELIPEKNPDRVIPDEVHRPGTPEFDEFPYLRAPDFEFDTFFGDTSDFATKWGFPADLSAQDAEPNPDKSWRFPIVEGGDSDRFSDTFVVISLDVIDLDFTGVGSSTVWSTSLWAWADDESITVPASYLETLPAIADITRVEGESQLGENLLGRVTMEYHRIIGWTLGDGFKDQEGRAVFDLQTIASYFFHNQNSCTDGIDNDEDGDIDQADSACREEDAVQESTECEDEEDNDEDCLIDEEDPDCYRLENGESVYDHEDDSESASCSDEVDNDGDGWIDLEDPGCESATDSSEGGYDYSVDCNNSVDDDEDGLVDFFDPGCESATDETETGDSDTCSDGIDNDEDGWIDGLDIACVPGAAVGTIGAPHTTRLGEVTTGSDDSNLECSDLTIGKGGIIEFDNDGDGVANAADPECAWGGDVSESQIALECRNLIDDDGDGWIDSDDAQCLLNPASESEPPGVASGNCSDGEDNDLDGWIDSLDPSCATANDSELGRNNNLECNDNIDNDEDGDIDIDDADCPTGKDAHEDR